MLMTDRIGLVAVEIPEPETIQPDALIAVAAVSADVKFMEKEHLVGTSEAPFCTHCGTQYQNAEQKTPCGAAGAPSASGYMGSGLKRFAILAFVAFAAAGVLFGSQTDLPKIKFDLTNLILNFVGPCCVVVMLVSNMSYLLRDLSDQV